MMEAMIAVFAAARKVLCKERKRHARRGAISQDAGAMRAQAR